MDTALLDWSRLQFAMTAAYHWLFVPLTLGLAIVMGIMETIYYKTRDEFWLKTTKFWMKLFGINFAVGIATGLILEFEFGTNWSNYSWFVGDIFGAPLAIEGIFAFFMEATFFAVMYFGWDKVSPRFHLAATWLTGIGATVSAYWILVANGWMQHPTGTIFNPDTVRNEMNSFAAVAFNPVAVTKFFHAVTCGWLTGGIFTLGVSCWFLLRKREVRFATQSAKIGAIVALVGAALLFITGDVAGTHIYKYQPMKLAAAEGLDDGGTHAPLELLPGIKIPGMLSLLATREVNGYVPGVNNIIAGGYQNYKGEIELSAAEKIACGKQAIAALKNYREQKEQGDPGAAASLVQFQDYQKYLGYGYLTVPEDVIPPRGLTYWSFHFMVLFGGLLVLLAIVALVLSLQHKLQHITWVQRLALWAIPVVYLVGQAGWIVAEVGRQPWAIQDLLPVGVALSSLSVAAVKTTFFVFLIVFTLFLAIEIRIMLKAIKLGPCVEEEATSKDPHSKQTY